MPILKGEIFNRLRWAFISGPAKNKIKVSYNVATAQKIFSAYSPAMQINETFIYLSKFSTKINSVWNLQEKTTHLIVPLTFLENFTRYVTDTFFHLLLSQLSKILRRCDNNILKFI
jgi:hypothetical protein